MRVAVYDHMEECTEMVVQQMLPLVSAQRREQALKYKHTHGRFSCLKSWLMLQKMVGISTKDAQNTDKTPIWCRNFEYNEHGKPFLPDGPYFSISHCKEGIAVAVDDEPIGIDIEGIRRVDQELVARVMNKDEQALISSSKEPERMFTRLWTQKEAIVKAQGVGIFSFEQLQTVLVDPSYAVKTVEKDKYIYSIAYGKLHCIGAKVPSTDL